MEATARTGVAEGESPGAEAKAAVAFYPNELAKLLMRPGQTFTVEPILCQGSSRRMATRPSRPAGPGRTSASSAASPRRLPKHGMPGTVRCVGPAMYAVGVWVGVGLAQDASVHEGTVLVNNAHLRPTGGSLHPDIHAQDSDETLTVQLCWSTWQLKLTARLMHAIFISFVRPAESNGLLHCKRACGA